MITNTPKTLHIISSLEVGGAEKLLIALLEAAKNADFQTMAVVVMNDEVSPVLKSQLLGLGFPTYFFNRTRSHKHPRYLMKLLQIVVRHGIRVIHVHDYGSKLWAALCKLVFPWLKLVFTIHDTRIVSGFSRFSTLLHRRWIDQNIAISSAVFGECEAQAIPNATLIYNGVDIARFAPEPNQNLAYKGPLRIVQVARLQPEKKGQDILLHALKQCKENGLAFHCKLVGGLSEETRPAYERLQALRDELGLTDSVTFVTDCTDVSGMLADHDLFILPSRYEGFGLVLVEAMAAGVPVIASNIDGPGEIVTDGVNGLLFESDNPDDLFDKIQTLHHSPEKREQLALQGAKTAQTFDIQVMLHRYVTLYRSLVNN